MALGLDKDFEKFLLCHLNLIRNIRQIAVISILKLKINFMFIISTFRQHRRNHEKMIKNYNNICYNSDKNL